nr:hypothetical protein [Tanacetum cinerariifolium]
ADAGHIFSSLKPLSQTNDSFSTFKLQRLTVQVVLSFCNTPSYQIVDGFLCHGFDCSGSPGRVRIGPGGSCSL